MKILISYNITFFHIKGNIKTSKYKFIVLSWITVWKGTFSENECNSKCVAKRMEKTMWPVNSTICRMFCVWFDSEN